MRGFEIQYGVNIPVNRIPDFIFMMSVNSKPVSSYLNLEIDKSILWQLLQVNGRYATSSSYLSQLIATYSDGIQWLSDEKRFAREHLIRQRYGQDFYEESAASGSNKMIQNPGGGDSAQAYQKLSRMGNEALSAKFGGNGTLATKGSLEKARAATRAKMLARDEERDRIGIFSDVISHQV